MNKLIIKLLIYFTVKIIYPWKVPDFIKNYKSEDNFLHEVLKQLYQMLEE